MLPMLYYFSSLLSLEEGLTFSFPPGAPPGEGERERETLDKKRVL